MKKKIPLLILIALAAINFSFRIKSDDPTDNALARVSKVNGRYVFYHNEPVNNYDIAFTFKDGIKNFDCNTVESNMNESVKNQNAATDTLIKSIGNLIKIIVDGGDAQSQTQNTILQFYNNTNENISAAIARYDDENSCWVSEGWWTIPSYKSVNLNLGSYTGTIYIHGEQSGLFGSTWGKGYGFCVDKDNAFSIRNADKIDCLFHKPDFSQKQLSTGINNWTFNP